MKLSNHGNNEILSYVKYDDNWYFRPLRNIPKISLGHMLKQSAAEYRDKIALTDSDGKNLSFLELDVFSDRFASFLDYLGVKKGDRVATQMPNSLEHVIVYFGIIKTGAISVPFNVMFKKNEIEYILDDSEAEVIVLWDQLYSQYSEIKESSKVKDVIQCKLGSLPILKHDSSLSPSSIKKKDFVYNFEEILNITFLNSGGEVSINPEEDIQLILYTAGTTGFPKGVMLSHYNFIYNLENRASLDNIYREEPTAITLFPMFHVSGYMLYLLLTIYVGGRTILSPRFEPGKFLELIERYKVNFLTAPPAVWIGMMNHPDIKKRDLSSFVISMAAGAPVPGNVQKRWQELTGLDLLAGYGLTETSATAISNLRTIKNVEEGCIGLPLGGEVEIVDDDGKIVPRNTHGEIIFRGQQVMKGYWKNPKATKEAFIGEGWLRTGDIGYINETGFTYFVDRKKDIIVASGYNIAPAEIENILLSHPAVSEAAVIGIPHEYRGETVKAFIVLNDKYKGKVSENELIEWAKANMAAYKYPRYVEFIEELPKSQTHKILRKKLRERTLDK